MEKRDRQEERSSGECTRSRRVGFWPEWDLLMAFLRGRKREAVVKDFESHYWGA